MSKEYLLRDEEALPLINVLDKANILSLPWSPEIQQLWQDYVNGLANVIEATIPNCTVKIHGITELEKAKQGLVKDAAAPSVTLDAYDTSGSFPLQLSRHFKQTKWEANGFIGIGERPGSQAVEKQVRAVKNYAKGAAIVLFEDDIFTGTTAKTTMDQLEAKGVHVAQFIAGLQIAHQSADPRIVAVHQYDPGEVHEITDPRDFLLGSYQGGLVARKGSRLSRVPYIFPYVNLTDRASIPQDDTITFSKAILDLNVRMFLELEELAGLPILVIHGSDNFVELVKQDYGDYLPSSTTMVDFCEFLKTLMSMVG